MNKRKTKEQRIINLRVEILHLDSKRERIDKILKSHWPFRGAAHKMSISMTMHTDAGRVYINIDNRPDHHDTVRTMLEYFMEDFENLYDVAVAKLEKLTP